MVKRLKGPLDGIVVIELAHIMAGPVCGLMLADMGADVIKVEKVPDGDDSRRFLPPDIKGESASFMIVNRNKRGIAVDLKTDDGKEIVRKMLATADVVIENYRRGTMERLGLGYEVLRKANSGLIYCEISGFGRTGPYRDRSGFDLIAQGMSGLMSITGEGAGRPPVKVGAPVTDITAGILSAMGVLAAYIHRTKTGEGQRVDTSLYEAGITHTYWQSAMEFAMGCSPGAIGSAHPLTAPYQAFPTSDGWINIGAANQANWLKLLDVLDTPRISDDPRFTNNKLRMENLKALIPLLNEVLVTRSTTEWLDFLGEAGVPAGPILGIGEMHRDPQAVAREMVVQTTHSNIGAVEAIGLPVKFSSTASDIKQGAPVLGEHSREVLAEYGYAQQEINRLVEDGVVITS